MKSREFRLVAVALIGLGLVFLARAGDTDQSVLGADSASGAPDVAVAGSGGVPAGEDPAGTGGLADELGKVATGRSIRLMDFGEIEQTPDLCDEGITEGSDAGELPIDVSGGRSGVIDEATFSELLVDEDAAYGDISGDGLDEAVVHTVCRYGASGRQHEIQVWETSSGAARPVGTVPEPARDVTGPLPPDIQGFAVDAGVLSVTWTRYAEGDPNCCPTGEITLQYRLVEGEIVEES